MENMMNNYHGDGNNDDHEDILHKNHKSGVEYSEQEDQQLNKAMNELTLHNHSKSTEMTNKNQDRVLTTSELIVSLIRCSLTDLTTEEKNYLIEDIDEVIKNHNFSMPNKSKINQWKTKLSHTQFIIDCCGHILNV